MAKDQPEATLNLTPAQFTAAIAAAVKEAMTGITDAMKPAPLPEAGEGARSPLPNEEVPARSIETTSKFTAVVVKSRSFPNGRVVRLDNYTLPDNIAELVPPGGGRIPPGVKDGPSMMYKHYVWQEFVQKDLLRYVGKPLPAEARLPASV
jgi:hypothetical protein